MTSVGYEKLIIVGSVEEIMHGLITDSTLKYFTNITTIERYRTLYMDISYS